ncbi:MAG: hypothetical protein RI513_02090 [Balneolaceae bacterium]|nr:hypothetical protein [Balneolaceae bacterium]
MSRTSSAQRKADHVRVTTQLDSQYQIRSGFETIRLKHQALPECSLDELLGQWKQDLSKVMCLVGATTLNELTPEKCYI